MKKYEKRIEGSKISFWDLGAEVFWIDEKLLEDRKAVEVQLGGNLRADSVHEFKTEMDKFLAVGYGIVLELSEVTNLSAAYMREFVHIQQTAETKEGLFLELKNLSGEARRALFSHGIHALLAVQD